MFIWCILCGLVISFHFFVLDTCTFKGGHSFHEWFMMNWIEIELRCRTSLRSDGTIQILFSLPLSKDHHQKGKKEDHHMVLLDLIEPWSRMYSCYLKWMLIFDDLWWNNRQRRERRGGDRGVECSQSGLWKDGAHVRKGWWLVSSE